MSMIEKLAGIKALVEAAMEEELARQAPPPEATPPNASAPCDHKNSEEITGAGMGPKRRACTDCGHEWEVE